MTLQQQILNSLHKQMVGTQQQFVVVQTQKLSGDASWATPGIPLSKTAEQEVDALFVQTNKFWLATTT